MRITPGLAIVAALSLVPWSASARADDFDDLGMTDISQSSEHCWIKTQGGRVGIATGVMDALVFETTRQAFAPGGVEPSIGKHVYAAISEMGPEPALIAAIDGERVTVVTPIRVVGYLFVAPDMPLALYPAEFRQPATTPRIWTGGVTRQKLLTMMECFDRLQGD